MDRYFFGLAVQGAFVLWLIASLPPLIGGLVMLARSHRLHNWAPDVVQLVATLILKPVVTGAIYLVLYLLLYFDRWPLRALPALAVLGPGVTALILWRFWGAVRTLPRSVLATLLALDLLRWVSAFLGTVGVVLPLVAFAMPTLFMLVAWLLIATGSADSAVVASSTARPQWAPAPDARSERWRGDATTARPPTPRRRLWVVMAVAVAGTVAVVTLPWTLGAISRWSRESRSSGAALQTLAGIESYLLTWSPDGSSIAAASNAGTVYVVYAVEDKLRFTYDTPSARIDHLAWSPRGDVIAIQLPIAVQLIDAHTGSELRMIKIFDEEFVKDPDAVITHHGLAEAVWSPDGHWLAVDAGPRGVVLLDPLNATADQTFGREGSIDTLAWSPDGRYLAIGESGEDEDVTIREVATGRLVGRLTTGVYRPQVAWSPDDAWLSVHGWFDRGVQLYAADTLERQARPIDQLDEIAFKAWSPDAQLLALERTDGTIEIWEPDGAAPLQRFPRAVHHATLGQLAWSHDGRWLAAPDIEGVWVWDNRSRTQQSLALPGGGGTPLWHPEQPWLIVTSSSGVRLIQLEP